MPIQWPTLPTNEVGQWFSQIGQWWDVWQWVFYMVIVEIVVFVVSHGAAKLAYRVVNIPQTAMIRTAFEVIDRVLAGDQGTWGARADHAIDVSSVWLLTFAFHGLLAVPTLCCQGFFIINLLSRLTIPYKG